MKVLAIDGGGIRGLIPALVLAEIESRTGRRIADMVDLIAGTSTGGILACALAKPDPLTASEVACAACTIVASEPSPSERRKRIRRASVSYAGTSSGTVAAFIGVSPRWRCSVSTSPLFE